MPNDILTRSLRTPCPHRVPQGIALRPLGAAAPNALASLYLESYPPGVAATDLADAQQEMDASLAGEFGALRLDASATAWQDDAPIGAVLVVERSIWDAWLAGPFIIDLFVSPRARGLGAGRSLVTHAVRACLAAGDPSISLRHGEGTSSAAMSIYRGLGFVPPEV